MQDRFSQLLPILGAIVAFLIAALLVLYIIRLLFGRRIRSSAAKKGLRRLDVVDVFDLDRERQLVIVRRDDTEHLLLIGGPNDLLVEGGIALSEAAAARAREARQSPAPAAWPPGPAEPLPPALPAGPPLKPAAGPVNLPPDLFAPAPGKPVGPAKPVAPEPAPAPAPAASMPPPPPAPQRPASPPPARPIPPRPATPPFLARTQRLIQPKGENQPPSAPPAASGPTPPPSSPSAPAPSAPFGRPAAPPPAPPMRAPAAPPPSIPSPQPEADPLDSLEAEMARLLGRPEKE